MNDYDHFFELFGVDQERRSGVYTANLDRGSIWTQDEEGNLFIVFANGDSVEKLSVSFDLDQLVEGIEDKEPSSPRMCDGEYIEEECKFLPPPKDILPPRLFMVRPEEGLAYEFLNYSQLEYFFRTRDHSEFKTRKNVIANNEDAISHTFLDKDQAFDSEQCLKSD